MWNCVAIALFFEVYLCYHNPLTEQKGRKSVAVDMKQEKLQPSLIKKSFGLIWGYHESHISVTADTRRRIRYDFIVLFQSFNLGGRPTYQRFCPWSRTGVLRWRLDYRTNLIGLQESLFSDIKEHMAHSHPITTPESYNDHVLVHQWPKQYSFRFLAQRKNQYPPIQKEHAHATTTQESITDQILVRQWLKQCPFDFWEQWPEFRTCHVGEQCDRRKILMINQFRWSFWITCSRQNGDVKMTSSEKYKSEGVNWTYRGYEMVWLMGADGVIRLATQIHALRFCIFFAQIICSLSISLPLNLRR